MTTVCIAPLTLGYPEGGGHLWEYLNWALGLQALGCRVVWLEDIGELAASRPRQEVEADIAILKERLERHGLRDSLALASFHRPPLDPALTEGCLDLDAACEAELLLDFAYDTPADAVGRFRRSAVVDLDPGLLQMWISSGDMNVAPHDLYFTTGETVGTPSAPIPDCGVEWTHTAPAVFLPAWPPAPASDSSAYTTVTNWWEASIEFDGRVVANDKRSAFLRYADLPSRSPRPLELAMTLDDYTEATDCRLLEDRGWRVADAWKVASSPERYRAYIQSSRGEFSCAKPSCALLQNAWISNRTLCYLASAKPAVVEHTGPSRLLADSEGLFRFRTLDEAAVALEAIESDYERHCRAARALAEERFDAEKVLSRMLELALT